MAFISTTLEASSDITRGLADGSLTRWGGVVRESGSGQVVAHLQEVGSGVDALQLGIKSIAGLAQIAAGASVLNLGVSAVGFAYTAHKLNQISSAVESMHLEMSEGFTQLTGRFDRVDQQLGYLRVLAEDNTVVQQMISDDLSRLVQHSVTDPFAELVAEVNRQRRFGGDSSIESVSRLDRLYMQLHGRARSFQPSLNPATLINMDMSVQGWIVSASMMAAMLEELGHADEAVQILAGVSQEADVIAQEWTSVLVGSDTPQLATVYRFAARPLRGHVLPERVSRIARYSPADSALTEHERQRRQRDAAIEIEIADMPDERAWANPQIAAAAFLDQLAETADRAASRHALALECARHGIGSRDLLAVEPATDGVYVMRYA